MLNEMTNGDAYYVSDNGRIRKKTGYSRDHIRYTDQPKRSLNNGDHYEPYQLYGSARYKSTQRYEYGPTYGNKNNDYGTTRVSTHPSSHTRYGDITRGPEVSRQSSDVRPPSDLYNYDHYSEMLINDHTHHGHYTQQYMDRFVNPSPNQRQNNDIRSTYVSYKKITDIYQPSDNVDSSISNTNITLCSINVCGLNSKLKYKTLQEYINKIDIIS